MRFSHRYIYLLMIAVVGIPIVFGFSTKPARMISAERMYAVVDNVSFAEGDVALVWLDFGPNTIAENGAQAEVLLEHLFRRRIPVLLLSQYPLSEGLLRTIPQKVASKLKAEMPDQNWRYGESWINGGFKPGSGNFIQSLVASQNISSFLGRDVLGMPIVHYPAFGKITSVENIKLVAEITGLSGVFDTIIQFFQKKGYRPTFVHGCTSITIPEAYIFLDSKQLHGLLEGIAGAAWYGELLRKSFPKSSHTDLLLTNTALGAAQITIIMLIIIGNACSLYGWWRRRDG